MKGETNRYPEDTQNCYTQDIGQQGNWAEQCKFLQAAQEIKCKYLVPMLFGTAMTLNILMKMFLLLFY